jgi:hypothetical protein
MSFCEVSFPKMGIAEIRITKIDLSEFSFIKASTAEIGFYIWMVFSPPVPYLYSLLDPIEMFLVGHMLIFSLVYADHATVLATPVDRKPHPSIDENRR